MIQVFKTSWKGETRIGLRFPYEPTLVAKIRKIKGAYFTPELGAWHFAYTPTVYQQFLELDIPYNVVTTDGTTDRQCVPSNSDITDIGWKTSPVVVPPKVEDTTIPGEKAGIKMCYNNRHITVQLPYEEENVRFLKTLKGAWWQSKKRVWVVKATLENLEKLQDHWYLEARWL